MSNRNFDFSAIVKILNAQNNANFYNRQQTVVQATTGAYTIDLQSTNPQTGHYDADTIATLQAGQQAYYFKGVPDTTVLVPQQYTPDTTAALPVPPTPVIASIVAGSVPGSLEVTYLSAGGVLPPITNYAYSTNNGSSFTTPSVPSVANPIIISGLASSTTFTVIIKAISANGTSLPSNAVNGTTN
jgi:hypothetical protein